MHNEGIHWLNQYKFTSGKSWREVARDLEVPEQVILSWMSGTNAPGPQQIRKLQELQGRLAKAKAPTQPEKTPATAGRDRNPRPITSPSSEAAEKGATSNEQPALSETETGMQSFVPLPDWPCLADRIVELADKLRMDKQIQGVAVEDFPTIEIKTGFSDLDGGLNGLPANICLHASSLEEARIGCLVWIQRILELNDDCGILISTHLPLGEIQRLWAILACQASSTGGESDPLPGMDSFLRDRMHTLERVWLLPGRPGSEDEDSRGPLIQRFQESLQVKNIIWIREESENGANPSVLTGLACVTQIYVSSIPPGNRLDWPLIGRFPDNWRPNNEARDRWLDHVEWSGGIWLIPPAPRF